MVSLLLLSSSTLHVNAVSLAQYDLWPLGMPINDLTDINQQNVSILLNGKPFLTFLVLTEIFNGKCPLNKQHDVVGLLLKVIIG